MLSRHRARREEPRRLSATPAAQPVIAEETLDEETQRYVSQALTDVDLFSSYGLTHKATHLLENVLQRAPRHTATLERLLDFYLGAGDERRTAELAAQLEQIHRERNDSINAERFAELRSRFEKAAGTSEEEKGDGDGTSFRSKGCGGRAGGERARGEDRSRAGGSYFAGCKPCSGCAR